MDKILVSGCLMGRRIRYNGTAKDFEHPLLERWRTEGRLVVVCPELQAGFSTPRPPAEIEKGLKGSDVIDAKARVFENTGADVTTLYVAGAQIALELALEQGCRFALLTDGSPSCGSTFIHDGSFSGRRHAAAGVTAALLQRHGVEVFAERQIEQLAQRLEHQPSAP